MIRTYNFGLGPVTINDDALDFFTPDPMTIEDFLDDNGDWNNKVFVAATNTQGQHGGGSARFAYDQLDLEWGLAEGLSVNGHVYAFPTLDYSNAKEGMDRRGLKIPTQMFKQAFVNLKKCALENPDKEFYLTKIGLGIAGWELFEVHKMFWESGIATETKNIHWPIEFELSDECFNG